jgi:uncharacterized protein (DUF2336 family)
VTVSDFRDIVVRGDAGKAERLFRAAVSAFCSLTRPSRREVAQLDDLTLPLLELVSVEARRYVAAALSECTAGPPGLVARLADDRVDVAAPLLARSPLLSDVHLIALIGRHGIGHARAIARRAGLNPTIGHLIRALEASAAAERQSSERDTQPGTSSNAAAAAEAARQRLRAMMRSDALPPAQDPESGTDNSLFGRLRDTALSGNETAFHTALANALGIGVPAARAMVLSAGELGTALRALDLAEEQAFLIVATQFAGQFAHAGAISGFLEQYRSTGRPAAIEPAGARMIDKAPARTDTVAARL